MRTGIAFPFLLLAMGVLLIGCTRRSAPIATPVAEVPPMVKDEPVVVDTTEGAAKQPYLVAMIGRTPCFGSCPAFEAWIYSDGTVLWCGEENVALLGSYKTVVPQQWIKELFHAADDAGIWQMAPQYPENGRLLQDVPLTVTYFNLGKKERRIVDNADAPLKLLRLESYFQSKLESLDWAPFGP